MSDNPCAASEENYLTNQLMTDFKEVIDYMFSSYEISLFTLCLTELQKEVIYVSIELNVKHSVEVFYVKTRSFRKIVIKFSVLLLL